MIEFKVSDMTCGHCASTITKAVKDLDAGAKLDISLAEHLVRVLAPDGLLVVETSSRLEPSLPLSLRTSRRYGSARLTLFEHTP